MRYSLILEYLIDFSFVTEFIIKIIAYGFFMDKHSYLTSKYFIYINLDNWNRLDFLNVCSGIVDTILIYHGVRALRILRLIKIIRSLRFISQNSNLKHVVMALLLSAGALANVTLVVFIFYLMYAILGISLLKGKLGYCDINNYYKISI